MQHFWRWVFRGGPALLTLVMVAGSFAYSPWQHSGSWPVYTIVYGAATVAAMASVARRGRTTKDFYVLYAGGNIILYFFLGIICLIPSPRGPFGYPSDPKLTHYPKKVVTQVEIFPVLT